MPHIHLHVKATALAAAFAVPAVNQSAFAQCVRNWLTHPVPSIGFEGIHAFAVFDDGSGPAIYAGGSFEHVCGEDIPYLARWNGATWSSVGAGVDPVRVLAALHVGAEFALYAVQWNGHVSRWNGSDWLALGDPDHDVRALAAFDDGSGGGPALFAAGGERVSKWDGAKWNPIGKFVGYVYDMTVHDAGNGPRLFVGGSFTQVNNQNLARLAKWNGTQWSAVGGNLEGGVGNLLSTTFGGDGSPQLYVSGVQEIDGEPVAGIARWDGSAWHALPDGHTLNQGVYEMLVWADAQGPALFVAGANLPHPDFDRVERVMKFDGAAWHSTGANFSYAGMSYIGDMTPFDDGTGHGERLWVGGKWGPLGGYIGNRNLELWDGQTWWPMPGPVGGLSNTASVIKVLDVGDGEAARLIAGGNFTFASNHLVNRIARWNGQSWSTFGAGFDRPVNALLAHDDGSGLALFAGGNFTASGPTLLKGVARWNGSAWQGLGDGIHGDPFTFNVYDLAAFDDGTGAGPALYAAGTFKGAGAVAASNIAKWDGSAWHDVGGGVQGDAPAIYALEVFNDGVNGPALFAAGKFFGVGSVAAYNIARWDGAAWQSVGGSIGSASTWVTDLQVHDDGSGPALYAAGSFTSAGGVMARGVARWNGAQWSAVGALNDYLVPSSVKRLAVFDDGSGPALFATNIGITRSLIARWNGVAWAGVATSHPLSSSINATFPLAADHNQTGAGSVLHIGPGLLTFAQWRGGGGRGLALGSAPHFSSFNSSNVTASVTVTSGGAVTLQWRRNGVPLVESAHFRGVNAERLQITAATFADEGAYDVVVANDCETIVGAPAILNLPCTADIAPPGVGDNLVDVNDLLRLVANWGATGSSNPADLNHDSVVNVNDLLIVINHWGACT